MNGFEIDDMPASQIEGIEIYDGPHYKEKPVFHTDETIGDFLAKA